MIMYAWLLYVHNEVMEQEGDDDGSLGFQVNTSYLIFDLLWHCLCKVKLD